MRATIATATKVATEIATRFRNGDPAADSLERLNALVPVLARLTPAAGSLPAEVRGEFVRLLDRVRAAVAAGDEWLARREPELIAHQARLRLRRAYFPQ
jgi:hypothetical protein